MLWTIRRHFSSSHRLGWEVSRFAALSCCRLSHRDNTLLSGPPNSIYVTVVVYVTIHMWAYVVVSGLPSSVRGVR